VDEVISVTLIMVLTREIEHRVDQPHKEKELVRKRGADLAKNFLLGMSGLNRGNQWGEEWI
jgi:hypothetical protein